MSKPEHGQDRIQREVEELLEKLDTFVPEERLASKIRNRARRKPDGEPGVIARGWKRVSRISLGQLMLAGFALILVAWFFRAPLGGLSTWLISLGLVMAAVAFVLSIVRGGTGRTIGGTVERRWRGQPIEYSAGPSAADRIRDWFRRRRR